MGGWLLSLVTASKRKTSNDNCTTKVTSHVWHAMISSMTSTVISVNKPLMVILTVALLLVLGFESESEATPKKAYDGVVSLFSSVEVTRAPVDVFTVKLMG